MQEKAQIIASHLFFKFLNEKFNFIGEPLTEKQVEYYQKAISLNKIRHLVYMFVDKNSRYSDLKELIEDEMVLLSMEFFNKEKEVCVQ
jgi:hypothetical protein